MYEWVKCYRRLKIPVACRFRLSTEAVNSPGKIMDPFLSVMATAVGSLVDLHRYGNKSKRKNLFRNIGESNGKHFSETISLQCNDLKWKSKRMLSI